MKYLKKIEGDFSLTFKNINYSIDIVDMHTKQTNTKTIINDVSGSVYSGNISAIMGPSGSGKTSLLNFLTSRIEFSSVSKHSGSIYANSSEISFNDVSQCSGYVMQDDILFDILTPYESLYFGCRLRKLVDKDQVDDLVNSLLEDLQLTACKNTLIGNTEKKGISGGERKRTSIGMELISNPSILFLDEPTSNNISQDN